MKEEQEVAKDQAEMESTLRNWLTSREQAEQLGENAKRFVLSQQGATEKTVHHLRMLLEPFDSMQQNEAA